MNFLTYGSPGPPGDDDMRFLRTHVTVETQATISGISGQSITTHTIVERGPGQVRGTGQGMFMASDGSSAIYDGHRVARIDETGGMHIAAAIIFQTASEQLSSLNGVMLVIEHHADRHNNVTSELYE